MTKTRYFYVILAGYLVTFLLGALTYSASGDILSHIGLGSATRISIGLFAGVITAMALIITLTANLYTPYVVQLFVKDKVIVIGTSAIVTSNLIILLSSFIEMGSDYYNIFASAGFIFSCLVLGGIVPFLHYASQYLKPTFFLPQLEDRTKDLFKKLIEGNYDRNDCKEAFHTIDVISNICYTASKREDKELMTLSLKSLHEIFEHILYHFKSNENKWRIDSPTFIPGLSQEGEYYLEKDRIWPEAFILGKIMRILNSLGESKNDVIPYVLDNLLASLDVANTNERDNLVELHLMIFNSLFRKALDHHNVERFQSVSYYYRLAIELLSTNPKYLNLATNSFLHYGDLCERKEMASGKETVLFDLSRIVLYMAYESEDMAIDFYDNYLLEHLKTDIQKQGYVGTAALRSIVKTYWESKAKKCELLCLYLKENFLESEEDHKVALRHLLKYDRDLHWEFNDRLLSFAHLSPNALKLATEFLESKNLLVAS